MSMVSWYRVVVPVLLMFVVLSMKFAPGCANQRTPIPPSRVVGAVQEAACGQMIFGYTRVNRKKYQDKNALKKLLYQADRMKNLDEGRHANAHVPSFLWGKSADQISFESELTLCMQRYGK